MFYNLNNKFWFRNSFPESHIVSKKKEDVNWYLSGFKALVLSSRTGKPLFIPCSQVNYSFIKLVLIEKQMMLDLNPSKAIT